MAAFERSRFLGVAAGLTLATAASAAPRPLPEFLDLAPPDTVAVAVVRWSELRASSLYRDCEERYAFGKDRLAFDDVVRLTGIDPENDIDTGMIALRGTPNDAEHGVLGVLAGRFDPTRISSLLEGDERLKLARSERLGAQVFQVQPPGERPATLAFVAPGLLLFGDSGSVEGALAARLDASQRLAADAGLRQVFNRAPHVGEVWGAVALERVLPLLDVPPGREPSTLAALKALRWVWFNADFGADLTVTVSGAARSADEAELVRQSVDGIIALGKLGAQDNADLLSWLAETRVERANDEVTFHTLLGPQMLDWPMRAHREQEKASGGARVR